MVAKSWKMERQTEGGCQRTEDQFTRGNKSLRVYLKNTPPLHSGASVVLVHRAHADVLTVSHRPLRPPHALSSPHYRLLIRPFRVFHFLSNTLENVFKDIYRSCYFSLEHTVLSKCSEKLHCPPELTAKDTIRTGYGDMRDQTGSDLETVSLLAGFHRPRRCCVQNWGEGKVMDSFSAVNTVNCRNHQHSKVCTLSKSGVTCLGGHQTCSDQTEDPLHKTESVPDPELGKEPLAV